MHLISSWVYGKATLLHSSYGTPTGVLDVAGPTCGGWSGDFPPATAVATELESASPGPSFEALPPPSRCTGQFGAPFVQKAPWLAQACSCFMGTVPDQCFSGEMKFAGGTHRFLSF